MTAFALKPLSRDAIPAAQEKAERYRLLNEPAQAESICLDILTADPGNERATITLLLAQTDMFEADPTAVLAARETLSHIHDPYLRGYYDGILHERRAHAVLRRGLPGAGEAAYGHFRDAMEAYDEAEKLRPAGNDEARLRYNACARILNSRPDIRPDTSDRDHHRDAEA